MIDAVDLMLKYNLTPCMARALLLLLNNKIVTHIMLEVHKAPASGDDKSERPITTDGKVLMHRLRRRLAGRGIEIRPQRCVGYWLDQESKEKILKDLDTGQMSLPLDREGKSESPPPLAA